AVQAFETATSMLLSFAPSIRLKTIRCPASSTTAIAIGTFMMDARRSAAAMMSLAPLSVRRRAVRKNHSDFRMRLLAPSRTAGGRPANRSQKFDGEYTPSLTERGAAEGTDRR